MHHESWKKDRNSRFQIPDSIRPPAKYVSLKSGFTLIELIMVMGLFGLLTTFASINLLRPQAHASLETTVTRLVTDLRQQQLNAMVGSTDGTVQAQAFGIFFSTNSYTLFHGTTYNASDASNFTTTLDGNLTISTTLPATQVVYARQSGEVLGFVDGSNTVTVKNTTNNEQNVITVNRLGVVSIN